MVLAMSDTDTTLPFGPISIYNFVITFRGDVATESGDVLTYTCNGDVLTFNDNILQILAYWVQKESF